MKLTLKLPVVLGLTGLLQACIITEPVSKETLKASENGAFTQDGRLFVVANNPQDESWIFEIRKDQNGDYYPVEYVKGTQDGTINGSLNQATLGEDCRFSGLTASGSKLYAACIKESGFLGLGADSVTLYQVNTQSGEELIKTGRMTDSNFLQQAGESTFEPGWFMANGMAVDQQGRLYVSNSKASLAPNRDAISQIEFTENGNSSFLDFTHKTWISGNEFFPNGVQIEGDTLYYAGGSDILKTKIYPDGSRSDVRLHFDGSNIATIDDFAIQDGYIAYSKVFVPGSVVVLKPADFNKTAKHLTTVPMPVIPSSIVYQQDTPAGNSLFPEGVLLVTSFFSGGLFQIEF